MEKYEKYESQLGLLFPIYYGKQKMFQTTNQLTMDVKKRPLPSGNFM